MAQTRYYEYKADDSTDLFNRRDLGISGPGVYKGFDVKFATTSGTNLVLYHELTGYKDVSSGAVESSFKGLVRTRQGTLIIEDGEITVGAAQGMTGNAAGNPRIDVVYLSHARLETVGGLSAGYGVKTGTAAATPTIPALDDTDLQIPIAYIYWPASTSDLSTSGVRIVRAAIAQVIDYQQPRLQEMTYNATAKTLNSQYRSNWYYINNIDANYKEIDGITLHGFNDAPEIIHVFTKQRLWVDSTGSFNPRSRVTGRTLVEAGELLTFIRATQTDIPSSGFYTLVRGDEMRRDTQQKITGQLIHNKGTCSINTANGEITLNGDGNVYQLDVDFATVTNGEINAITSFASLWDGTTTRTKDGALVVLRIKNTGSAQGTLKLIDGATPSSSSFAPLETGTGDSFVADDAYLVLVENNTAWHVLVNSGTESDEWIDAGTAPVLSPDTGAVTIDPADVIYNKFRISHGTLNWQFHAEDITVSGSPAAILFEIPQEIQDLGLEIGAKGLVQLGGLYDSAGTPFSLYVTLGKSIAGTDLGEAIVLRKTAGGTFADGTNNKNISFSISCELVPV